MHPSRLVAVIIATCLSGMTNAQVVSNPNQIVGTVTLTNANPAVLALLNEPANEGFAGVSVTARSLSPAPLTTHVATNAASSRTSTTYEVTVEGSDVGIAYRVWPRLACGANGQALCLPAEISAPVFPEPSADAVVDFSACVAVLQVRFVDEAGAPVTVNSITLDYLPDSRNAGCAAEARPTSGLQALNLLVPSGRTGDRLDVSYEINGARQDETIDFPMGCACDELIDVPITVPQVVFRLGSVKGRFDLLGVTELVRPDDTVTSPGALVRGGPEDTSHRFTWPVGVAPDSTEFTVSGVIASEESSGPAEHEVRAFSFLDTPGRYTDVTTPSLPVRVDDGVTTDVGDAFVIEPGWFDGRISFVGPLPAGSVPLLSQLRHPASLTSAGSASTFRLEGVGIDPAVHGTRGSVHTAFVGEYVAATGQFDASVRFPVPSLSGVDGRWRHALADLNLEGDPPTSDRHVDAHVTLNPFTFNRQPAIWSIGPRDVFEYEAAYCFADVTIEFRSSSGTFFDPRIVNALGTRTWPDFRGRNPAFQGRVTGNGSPVTIDQAAAEGSVVLAIPEGDWRLWPALTMVNPSGGTTNAELDELRLHVGCREVIVVRPEIQVEISPALESCTPTGDVVVAGEARATDGVARVAYSLAGGPEVDVCAACGTTAPFSFTVPMSIGQTIRIVAGSTTGLDASTEATLTGPPDISSGESAAAALRVVRADATTLRISWERDPTLVNLHEGTIASLGSATGYDHRAVMPCRRAEDEALVPMTSADAYYLVAAGCVGGEGSYGRDSFGRERPPGSGCP